MKPAVCYLCGKSAIEENPTKKGDWIEFEDYKQESTGSLSHPIGLEYFCNEHLSASRRLKHKESGEALAELKEMFPPTESSVVSVVKANQKSSWWRRWIHP